MSTSKQFQYAWEWRLAATPTALWPFVSDTNRFNRDAGVPAVEELPGSTAGSRRLRLRRYGVLVEWEEEPFEWIRPRTFGVVRRYATGPVSELRVHAQLIPDGESHTRLAYEVTATARNALGRIAIPLEIGLLSRQRFAAVFRRYAQEARSASSELRPPLEHRIDLMRRAARPTLGGEERLARARAALGARFDADAIERLIEVIVRGDDFTVARIRPYVLADSWGAPRRAVRALCLHATRAGLLDLQWDMLCPHCRGARQSNDSLNGISQPVHCESCNIDFYANFEQSVELTFRPSPAIRVVDIFPFCIGGPQVTPHIVVQQLLRAAESRAVHAELATGRYRVRTPAMAGAQLFRIEERGADRIELTASAEGWQSTEPVAGSGAACVLANATDCEQLLIVERIAWSDQALTAAEVIALQEFRDLFSSEALRAGESINVGNMTILFTDLRDSTRMYREIGDAPAFGRVMSHFDVLKAALQEEDGALIKTIGDAVMAVFRRPAAAIRTIFRAQQLLASFPDGVCAPNLKAGVHFGSCIAVTLNDRLDYFGSTVNIAARLGALSRGGEIVISDTVANDPEVQALLQEAHVSADSFEANVKGYDDVPLQLLRVTSTADIMVASPS